MIEIRINEFTRRFLLLIYFLGESSVNNERFLRTKKKFVKLYFLSIRPKILEKVLEILLIEKKNHQKTLINKLKDTFFVFFHGVYPKNLANKFSESIRLNLIRIEKDGRSYIYFLTERGTELVKSILDEKNSKTQEYISSLKIMNPLKEISTEKITMMIDRLIEKKNKKLGARI